MNYGQINPIQTPEKRLPHYLYSFHFSQNLMNSKLNNSNKSIFTFNSKIRPPKPQP